MHHTITPLQKMDTQLQKNAMLMTKLIYVNKQQKIALPATPLQYLLSYNGVLDTDYIWQSIQHINHSIKALPGRLHLRSDVGHVAIIF